MASMFLILILKFSQAYYGFDLNTFYFSDSFNTGTATTSTRTFWSAALLLDTAKTKRFYVGWNILGVSAAESGGTSTTFSTADMGPKLLWVPAKNGYWTVEGSYNLIVKGAYSTGGSSSGSQWTGSSIYASVGYLPELGSGFYGGIKLNYYSVSYNKEIISTSIDDISYSRRWIFPSICLQLRD